MDHSPDPHAPSDSHGAGDTAETVRCAGYAIGPEAGFGRSARIFRARERSSGRDVALKILCGDEADPGAVREAMHRDAAVAAALANRTDGATFDIVPTQDAALAEIDGRAFPALISRWFDGEPLGQWLQRPHGLAARARATSGLLDAVAALHAAGFAHNDLGFGNLLVGSRKVALIDFGRATPLAESGELLRTLAANGFYDGGPRIAAGGGVHDLRAFAILAALVLARHHPFCDRPADLFAGAVDASRLFRNPPDLSFADRDEQGGPDLAGWLGPALMLAPDESAAGLRQRSPLDRPDHW